MISKAEILRASILIVDDQKANVNLLDQMLREAGYTDVSSTMDAREVSDLHKKHRYDLIILDLQMPVMDGFEVMGLLKKTEVDNYLPVLVVTAQPGHKLRALKAGARDFISKPFDLAEVLARVHGMIELRLLHEHGTVANVSRLETAQRIAQLGDWEYDFTKNHRLRWSDEVYHILGIQRSAFSPNAETFYKHVHPDDLAAVKKEKLVVAKGLRRVDFEHRIIRADGEVRFVRQVAEMTFGDDGEPLKESGTVQDITERKLAEATIRENEERYRKMLALSPDALFVHVDGIITFVNEAFCQMMRTTDASQLIGRVALTVTHPNFRGLKLDMRSMHSEWHSVPCVELEFLRLDGSSVPVEVASVAFDFRGQREVQVIARDISVRLNAVAALRESEERFKFVARAVSDVVWDWNLATDTLWWNDGFLATFGFASGDMDSSADSWKGRIHPDDRIRVVSGIHQAIETNKESWSAEYRFQRKDGTYAYVHDRGYILRDKDGKGIRMVGGMHDLTEKKKMEEQHLRSQRMESIGTLAGGIAHDLNNVLAPIMMAIELLKQGDNDETRKTKILETIYASCRRGADLVRQVLSFARGIEHQRVALTLGTLVEELSGIIGQTFPRNIRIKTDIAKNLWPVTGDPSQLHQVLLNLAVNARDAMPKGGRLKIAASNVTVDAQFAATSNGAFAGTYVLLEVSDTGSGIAPEVRDRMFEAFFTTKEVGKGTGLGLSTVHTVVKNHGGFLKVDSEVGKGTVFKIYLPADLSSSTANSVSPIAVEIPRGKDELVLVVDDERSIVEITRHTLESYGYRVITAANGAEAVSLYAKQPLAVSLVITDMMMPIMDGIATIHVLGCINPCVRIIAASGLLLAENSAKASAAGVRDFLQKPYSAETLYRMVRTVIDRPEPKGGFTAHAFAMVGGDDAQSASADVAVALEPA
jgi:PAS domain S-box-containing protein